MPLSAAPIIPDEITVHLGKPDEYAENITVPFSDYIKNVASSEIYPTWPEAAIRANILAQISYALNRIYTEYYPSRGYDFDITADTQFDQKYIKNRDIFENISRIVDDIFNDYVVRQGNIEPLFTQYCSGDTVTCPGLSQWGTVGLAESGMVPYEILQHYYGDDINIVFDAPVKGIEESYPGVPIRLGSAGEEVRILQRELNRIADNYPAIPHDLEVDAVYGLLTEDAVRTFQEIFNLTPDGIVGRATWYKIKSIYNGIKRLNELQSEGLTPEEVERRYSAVQREGDTGVEVDLSQYLLDIISIYDDAIPRVARDGIFGPKMADSVRRFQQEYGLPVTGEIDRDTWNEINRVYRSTVANRPPQEFPLSSELYPGRYLSLNMTGDDVSDYQQLLRLAAQRHSFIPPVDVTGTFDQATENATIAVQTHANLLSNGAVGPLTWARVVELANDSM